MAAVDNTTTTIITFLMVFLTQNTQNRDAEAMQIKLDEIIRVMQGAHLALRNGKSDTDVVEVFPETGEE